jgi:uncharacterized protein with FMN-binding domain
MKRITLWLLSTVVGVVLLFTYRTSTMGAGTTSDSAAVAPATDSGNGATTSDGGNTVDGEVASTRWGSVQVRLTVVDGRITEVQAIQYPNGNREDQRINAYALPILREETLSAQNASINTVSGATVTSEGFIRSLQSAVSAAHLD